MACKINELRARMHANERLTGLWCSMTSATAVEALSTLAYDWFLLDMEHAPKNSRTSSRNCACWTAAPSPPWCARRPTTAC
nr:aldolase/citrate lyase family protein [Xylophilus sp. ASV27]